MKYISKGLMAAMILSSVLILSSTAIAFEKPRMLKPCAQCHEVESNQLRGRLISVSNKAKTLQLFTGGEAWQLTFNDDTELDGAQAYSKIGKNKEILVDFTTDGKKISAERIMVKQPASIPQQWILDVNAMAKLAKKSPDEGNYALYDARPGKLFLEAHMAGAISNYDATFDKNLNLLPEDKDKLVIFYCGGMT